MKQNLKCK